MHEEDRDRKEFFGDAYKRSWLCAKKVQIIAILLTVYQNLSRKGKKSNA